MWWVLGLGSMGLDLSEEGSPDLSKGWKGEKLGSGVEGKGTDSLTGNDTAHNGAGGALGWEKEGEGRDEKEREWMGK